MELSFSRSHKPEGDGAASDSRSHKAFSLLELVMVVAILSIGILAVVKAFSFTARVAGMSGDIARASFLAQDKFGEFEFLERQGLISEQAPEGSDEINKFKRSYTITDIEGLPLLKSLNIAVSWKRAKKEESLNFSTYLLQ